MAVKPIVALQGATNREIQAVLAVFARDCAHNGVRVAGMVEVENLAPSSPCAAFVLRDIVTSSTYPIYQNLGPGSTACKLDARGVISACEAVCRRIRGGDFDLVVLSKFGKLEAARTGLTDAFATAVEAGIPIVTAVAPPFAADWHRFSAPLAAFMPPEIDMLVDWWSEVRFPAAAPAWSPWRLDADKSRSPARSASGALGAG